MNWRIHSAATGAGTSSRSQEAGLYLPRRTTHPAIILLPAPPHRPTSLPASTRIPVEHPLTSSTLFPVALRPALLPRAFRAGKCCTSSSSIRPSEPPRLEPRPQTSTRRPRPTKLWGSLRLPLPADRRRPPTSSLP
jgi:hypothetical protein